MIADQLIDPESARFRFGAPLKAYGNEGLIHGGKIAFVGYVLPVAVNAKNRMGGYVGFEPWFCGFETGSVRGCSPGDYRMHPLITLVP